jgi:hypothetical protein
MSRLLIAVLALTFFSVGPASASAQDDCATPVALASPTAGDDPCAWPGLIAEIDAEIANAPTDQFSVSEANAPIDSKYLPDGWSDGATWHAELPAGGGAHWASLLQYESVEALERFRLEYELALKAEYFVPATVRSLEDPDACFVLLREESVRGICLFERDSHLIVGYSFFETDIKEGQIATALALARVVDDARSSVVGNC